MIAKKVWIDKKIMSEDQVKMFPFTQGLNYGACIYEGIRFYDLKGKVAIFRLEDHLNRFFYSAKTLEMDLKMTKDQFKKAIIKTIKANNLKSGYIRPLAFYSNPKMGINILDGKITVLIVVWPWEDRGGARLVRLKVSSKERISSKAVDLKAKISGYYAGGLLAFIESRKSGFDEPLFLDSQGYITEGAISNIFVVKKDVLYTPKGENILEGITRDSIISLALINNIKVKKKNMKPDFLKNATEVFLTGSGVEIEKVKQISGFYLKNDNDWKITDRLVDLYRKSSRGESKEFYKWLTVF
jgi:branched-chain amino acid aminotransferase